MVSLGFTVAFKFFIKSIRVAGGRAFFFFFFFYSLVASSVAAVHVPFSGHLTRFFVRGAPFGFEVPQVNGVSDWLFLFCCRI